VEAKAVYTSLYDLYSRNLETYMNAILKASKLAAIFSNTGLTGCFV